MDYKIIKTSKNKEAIIYNNFYYNKFRLNQKTTYFKCRESGCHASLSIYNESGELKKPVILNHNGNNGLSPIEIDIKEAINEIKEKIKVNPNEAVLKLYEDKEVELSVKYKDDHDEFLKLLRSFHQVDSVFYKKKSALLPKMPQNIQQIVIPDDYTKTLHGDKFLISSESNISQYIAYSSRVGLEALAVSKIWNCDGTFKSAPKLFYQNYIMHGYFKQKIHARSVFAFLTGF